MKNLIYLAGPITGLSYDSVISWREEFALSMPMDIECLSPLRGKTYLKDEKEISSSYEDYVLSSAKGITTRDYNDCKRQGTSRWYKDGKLHSYHDQPAVIYSNGSQQWYKDGRLHRDNDQPAIIWSNGQKEWYQNGLMHRDNDLPAIIYKNGNQHLYKNGELYKCSNISFKT